MATVLSCRWHASYPVPCYWSGKSNGPRVSAPVLTRESQILPLWPDPVLPIVVLLKVNQFIMWWSLSLSLSLTVTLILIGKSSIVNRQSFFCILSLYALRALNSINVSQTNAPRVRFLSIKSSIFCENDRKQRKLNRRTPHSFCSWSEKPIWQQEEME